ncbi:MAG: fibronectin type III domain-containing protein [Methanomassiliicoccales archaeon]
MIIDAEKLKQGFSLLVFIMLMITGALAIIGIPSQAQASTNLGDSGLGVGTAPSAPRDLTVDHGPGFNWLWWRHPVSQGSELIKRYEIWRGETPGGETLHDWVYVGSTYYEGTYLGGWEFYNDSTDVNVGTTYYYKIRAVSDAGSGPFSSEVSATPSYIGDVPLAPSVTGQNGIYSADVSWDWPSVPAGSPPARFFFTYRDPPIFFSDTWDEWLRDTSASDEAGFDTRVGSSYTYSVRAVNTYGQGDEGTVTVLIQGTGNLPSAPLNLNGYGFNKSVMLTWSRPSNPSAIGFESYEVWRATASNGPFTKITEQLTLWGYDGFFFDAGLTNGVTYWYKVRAKNTNGVSEFSNVIEATPTEFSLPFEVSHLMAYPGNNQVLLIWGSAWNATGYDIYRGESSGGEVKIDQIAGTNYYFDTSALNGHTYYYYVKPKRGSFVGNASNEVSVTPSVGEVPGPPVGLVATPDVEGAMLYLPSQTVTSILIGYEVYRNGTAPGTWDLAEAVVDLFAEYGFSWWDSGRIDSMNYQYKVRLKNLYGVGPFSDVVTSFGSPTGERPDSVSGLTATGGPGKITLQWPAPYSGTARLLYYRIERNDTGGSWNVLGYLDETALNLVYEDDSAIPGVTYRYRVLAMNNYGDADDYSNEASASAATPSSPPSAPLGLSAQSSLGQVILTWNAPASQGSSPITGYKIFRGTTPGGQGATPIATVSASTLTYTDVVAPGTYYYVVKATNAVGDSPASNEASGSSLAAQPPSAPTNLTATGYNRYVVLTWNAPSSNGSSSILRYDVFRGLSADRIGIIPIGNTPANSLTYNDTMVSNGITYYYQVKAVNSEGSSPASNVASATPTGPAVPSAPRNVVAVGHDGYVTVTWEPPANQGSSPIVEYRIFRSTVFGIIGDNIMSVNASTFSWNDDAVTNGVTYYYAVKAVNEVGASPESEQASATPSETGTAPGAPTGLVAMGQVGMIVLTWNPPSDAGSGVTVYQIFRSITPGVYETLPFASIPMGTLTYTDYTVTPGVTYYYKVRAFNPFGLGPFSNEVFAIASPPPSVTPSFPQNLTATSGEGKVTLAWQPPSYDGGSPITGYQVYRRQGSGTPTLLATLGPDVLTYEDTTATAGITYTYWVVATNANGAGELSAEVNAFPQEPGGTTGGGMDMTMLLVIGVVVIVVVLAALTLLMRKRK